MKKQDINFTDHARYNCIYISPFNMHLQNVKTDNYIAPVS